MNNKILVKGIKIDIENTLKSYYKKKDEYTINDFEKYFISLDYNSESNSKYKFILLHRNFESSLLSDFGFYFFKDYYSFDEELDVDKVIKVVTIGKIEKLDIVRLFDPLKSLFICENYKLYSDVFDNDRRWDEIHFEDNNMIWS